jgi:hypothetical protein
MNDHLFSVLCLFIAHLLSLFVKPNNLSKLYHVRWFAVHAIINLIISINTCTSVYKTIQNPSHAADVKLFENTFENRKFPMCLVLWLHLYHVVFYPLSSQDVFHHFLFVTLLPIPGYVFDWGIIGNCNLFFICGSPGFLIYLLLTMQKCGMFLTIDEPRFSAFVNILFRCPGIILSSMVLLQNTISGVCTAPIIAILIQISIGCFNAVYYAHQSMERMERTLRNH